MEDTIKVKTTQNVEVEYEVASLGDRVIAHLIDHAVYFAWLIVVGIVMQQSAFREDETTRIVLAVLAVLPVLFYNLVCEIFLNGQSIGKKARDIKVIKLSGEAPTLSDYLLRWVFRLVDTVMSVGLVALVTIAANSKNQRLGDLAAGTCVIRTRAVTRQRFIRVKTEENYQINYPEVSLLTDKDVALVRKLLYKALMYRNEALLEKLADRVQEVTGIQHTQPNDEFLKTVVKDYHHLSIGMEVS